MESNPFVIEPNPYSDGNRGGRPALFESVEELEQEVIKFFDKCRDSKIKATVTGLALSLGFESRQSLYDYEQKGEFSYIIKRAKLAVENSYELNGQTIDIFALKNMGWKDKTEVDNNIKGSVNIVFAEAENCDPIKDNE